MDECNTVSEEKRQSKKSTYTRDCKTTDNLSESEIDIVEHESPSFLKQLAKRKYTVIDPGVQIVSGLVVIKTLLIQ